MRQSRRRNVSYNLGSVDRVLPRITDYACYIASDAWLYSPARLTEIESAGGLCRLCARGAPEVIITVHHRSYAHLGRERPTDLVTLCLDCHDSVHEFLRARALADIALPSPVDLPARRPRVLVDSLLGWRAP